MNLIVKVYFTKDAFGKKNLVLQHCVSFMCVAK